MVIYFTGTGNSKYLAQLAAQALEDTAVDAAALIKSGQAPAFDSQKPYVFVCPVYAWRMPRLFQSWIKKCTFRGSRQAYFIVSCGESMGAAANYIKPFAGNMGFAYMGTAQVVMPENYLVMFDPTPPEKDADIIEAATGRMQQLCRQIAEKKPFDAVKNTFTGHLCSDIVTPFFYAFYIGTKKFYATDRCIGCGKCAENCMLGSISLKDGKPVWGKDCTHCMACISKCPTEAIEYGKNTKNRRRYVFPG